MNLSVFKGSVPLNLMKHPPKTLDVSRSLRLRVGSAAVAVAHSGSGSTEAGEAGLAGPEDPKDLEGKDLEFSVRKDLEFTGENWWYDIEIYLGKIN